MHAFFCPDLQEDLITLPEEEAHHAANVLRLQEGVVIGLLNGIGILANAKLMEVSKKRVVAQIEERTQHAAERISKIHLAVAPTKQMERYEWFVEKAVEIGVDRITPLITARTERSKLRLDRLQRVAISAMKQSQRTYLPRIDELTKLQDLLKEPLPPQRYFGWCEGEHTALMSAYHPTSDVIVFIGPEGDLSEEEAQQLRALKVQAVSIGNARLRTETAALTVCAWLSLAQQR